MAVEVVGSWLGWRRDLAVPLTVSSSASVSDAATTATATGDQEQTCASSCWRVTIPTSPDGPLIPGSTVQFKFIVNGSIWVLDDADAEGGRVQDGEGNWNHVRVVPSAVVAMPKADVAVVAPVAMPKADVAPADGNASSMEASQVGLLPTPSSVPVPAPAMQEAHNKEATMHHLLPPSPVSSSLSFSNPSPELPIALALDGAASTVSSAVSLPSVSPSHDAAFLPPLPPQKGAKRGKGGGGKWMRKLTAVFRKRESTSNGPSAKAASPSSALAA